MSERTYQALLDRIAARQIGSGEVLEERRLAEELNVSRTPMRAALNRLLGEGILKRLSNGSVVVHAFGVTELLELLQIRQLLEGQAAAMAAGRIPGDKLAAVKARLEDVMRYSAAGGIDLDRGQRGARAGGRLLRQQVHGRDDRRRARRARLCNVERLSQRAVQARAEHLAIVQALQAGDAERARATMTAHLAPCGAFARTLGYLPHED